MFALSNLGQGIFKNERYLENNMKLLEHSGKDILRAAGIHVPPGIVTDNKSYVNLSYHKERYRQFFFEHGRVIIKAQVIATGRKKAGLIVTADDYKESLEKIEKMYEKEHNGVPVQTLLIEKLIDAKSEHYLSVFYDTRTRTPAIAVSMEGGVDVEERATPTVLPFSVQGLHEYEARALAKQAGFSGREMLQIATLISNAAACFLKHDCTLLEINPILLTKEGMLYAGDAKITIDDSAVARHDIFHDITDLEDRSFLSERELAARRIDVHDHRGVAGKTFVDLDGDIAVLASGGGASLTAMDAIIQAGGRPANYTEYSGNPSREKVRRLTEITLSRKGLKGCLVVGGKANFTDIYETLSGFMDALCALRPDYPIVIRRAGPRDKEAFDMIRRIADKEGFDITLYGEEIPISKAAHMMVQKI